MRLGSQRAWVLRAGFVFCGLGLSVLLPPFRLNLIYSAVFTALFATACLLLEQKLHKIRLSTLLGGSAGLLAGLGLGALIDGLFVSAIPPGAGPFLRFFVPLCTAFLGLAAGAARADSFHLSADRVFDNNSPATNTLRFLDTSSLIDGRIADLADAGFLEGLLVIPQFVLNELQTVADSADAAKRNRGRRGLELVARLRSASGIRLEISPVDYADTREVDWKLIEAARHRNAQIVTTDFNLSKLAQAQGIRVLNMNELASALRPVVLQGETMRVVIAKEGKEPTQGIAYLEDGTMVVVDNARRQIAKTIDITVTGVVQNASGKMIFGKYEELGKGGSSSRAVGTGFSRPL